MLKTSHSFTYLLLPKTLKALDGFPLTRHEVLDQFLRTRRQKIEEIQHSAVILLDDQVVEFYILANELFTGILGTFLVSRDL